LRHRGRIVRGKCSPATYARQRARHDARQRHRRHHARLRRKIDDPFEKKLLHTVRAWDSFWSKTP